MNTHVTPPPQPTNPQVTPGLWRRVDADDYATIQPVGKTLHSPIALVGNAGDANVIAAAPRVLAALMNFDNAFTDFDPDDRTSAHTMRLAVIEARELLSYFRGPA